MIPSNLSILESKLFSSESHSSLKVNSACSIIPRPIFISPRALFCITGQCLIQYMPHCHWVLIAWVPLGYMYCTYKCWVSYARVKCIVVTPKFSLVWACHKVSHNLPCLRLGLFPLGTRIHHVMPSTLSSLTTHWYFSSCLKAFHPDKQGWLFVFTHPSMTCQACSHYVLPIIFGHFSHQNVWLHIYQFAWHYIVFIIMVWRVEIPEFTNEYLIL